MSCPPADRLARPRVVTASLAVPLLERDAAVSSLVACATGRGFAVAFDLLGDRGEAEDAVQEALVRALGGLHRVREPAALPGWYLRVLTNLCIGVLRRRRVATAFARLVAARGEPSVAAADLGPDHARMLAVIDGLPAMQKAALILRHGHDLGVDEIAAVLDVGVETVKTHLKRARARVRTDLGVTDDHR